MSVVTYVITCFAAGILVARGCEDGFVKHRENCYHFSHDTETWINALTACRVIYNSQLVEIVDPGENAFLVNESTLRHMEYWIGADDLRVEGEWMWATSGDQVSNRTSGNRMFISNSANNENCLEINAGSWNDDRCDKSQHYICQKSVQDPTVVG
ncbi:perlucin-like [Dreissena polymorpha]|uniref:C-type lectin domain-containing protein n=1 Tax=Dreissena polymorpha TaxID=45954 RepID=A0A9D4EX09_DREPO|nr:perlucin-like [Dreissena polymorpha]KAH3787767.1 hypothetical protein DPMN_165896 [Dreissena polymorpha]